MPILNMVWEPTQTTPILTPLNFQVNTNINAVTIGTYAYDAAFSRYSFSVHATRYTFNAAVNSVVSELWTHFSLNSENSQGASFVELVTWGLNGVGNGPQIRLASSSPSSSIHTLRFQRSIDGGVNWIDVITTPSTFNVGIAQLNRYDVRIRLHATLGVIEFYVNDVLRMSYSGPLVTRNNLMDYAFFTSDLGTFTNKHYSEIIFADTTTLGYRLFSMTPNAAGAQADFIGTFTDIDDTTPDLSDFINSNTVGAFSFFNLTDLSNTFLRYGVVAVGVNLIAAITPDSLVNDLQLGIRSNLTNFFSANMGIQRNSTANSRRFLYETNPVTSLPWSFSEVNALQVGIRAV